LKNNFGIEVFLKLRPFSHMGQPRARNRKTHFARPQK
jgi:hypothetical protein